MTHNKPTARWCLLPIALVALLAPGIHSHGAEPQSNTHEANQPQSRKWTDSTGSFSVEAEFTEIRDGQVILKGMDGSSLSIALDRLSLADQQYVAAELTLRLKRRPETQRAAKGNPGAPRARTETAKIAVPGTPTAGPAARTRRTILGDLYTQINKNADRIKTLQSRQAIIIEQIQPVLKQCELIEAQAREEFNATQTLRRAFEQSPNGVLGKDGPSLASLVAESNQRIALFKGHIQRLLLPFEGTFREKASLEQELALSIAKENSIGEQMIWQCDPLGRMPPLDDQDSVVDALTTCITQQEGSSILPHLYVARGFEHLRMREYSAADEDFVKGASYPPLTSLCTVAQAMSLEKQEKVAKSNELFSNAIKAAPNSGVVRLFRANVYIARGSYPIALQELKLALKLSPEQPQVHEAMARLLATCPKVELRNEMDAIKHARKACELSQGTSWTFLETLSIALASTGKMEAAVDSARKALNLAPVEAASTLQQRIDAYQHQLADGAQRSPAK